jgi:hypothetical protein
MSAATQVPAKGELAPNVAAWVRPHTPGPLTASELDQFFKEGYVIKRGLVPAERIAGAKKSIETLVDTVAEKLFAAGKIADKAEGAPFETRLVEIEKQYPAASVLLHKQGVLPLGIAEVWSCDELVSVAKQVLGPEEQISGHPVWNLRCKVPTATQREDQSTVPWHQE